MKVCTVCGLDETTVEFSAKALQCNKCYADNRRKRELELRAIGKCLCGSPLVPERTKCSECLLKSANKTKRFHTKNRLNGFCDCGKEMVSGRRYCSVCLENSRTRVVEKVRDLKARAIAFLGGKCHDCGLVSEYQEVYDLHHQDPSVKTDKLSSMMRLYKVWDRIEEEVRKCILLCANCHRIRHAKESLC